jgi:cyclopropane fatty-acyl-phospholipid synthase-like methyltransferase
MRALDLGCGSGVHTVFLATEGFDVTAVDLSPTGVALTQRKLDAAGMRGELGVASIEAFEQAGPFSLVICAGVLECAGVERATKAIRRVFDRMADGGCGVFVFASDRDFRVAGDNPLALHGFTRSEVDSCFAVPFGEIFVDRYITTYRGGDHEQNDWLVTVRK